MTNLTIGFETLPPDELHMLLCFDDYGELILPDLIPKGNSLLHTLIKKGIVLDRVPYCLSKRGLKLYKAHKYSHHK